MSEAVDKSLIERSEPERFISCLAAMQDRKAKPGLGFALTEPRFVQRAGGSMKRDAVHA